MVFVLDIFANRELEEVPDGPDVAADAELGGRERDEVARTSMLQEINVPEDAELVCACATGHRRRMRGGRRRGGGRHRAEPTTTRAAERAAALRGVPIWRDWAGRQEVGI